MRKVLVLLLVSTISIKAYSQECDCTSTFEWLKSTFEQNDAGFEYYLKQKGEVNYTLLT